MSRTAGVNAGFAKCFVLFMSITILLQGFLYLGVGIWALVMGRCTQTPINIKDEPIKFAMNLIYLSEIIWLWETSVEMMFPRVPTPKTIADVPEIFIFILWKGKECGNPTVKISDIIGDRNENVDIVDNGSRLEDIQEIQIDWDKALIIKDRVHVILVMYIVISALWIVTSFLVLASICCKITNLLTSVCYWPWFLMVMIGSVVDAIASGYFINDIYNTTSTEDTLEYIGVIQNETNSIVIDYLKKYSGYFVVPAVVMTSISSRVVFFWLLNVFGVIFCLSMARVLSVQDDSDEVPKPKQRTPVDDIIVTPRPLVSPKESTYHLQWVHPPHHSMHQISPKPLILPRPTIQNELSSNNSNASPQSSRSSPLKKQVSPSITKSISFSKRISDLKSKSNDDDESPTYRSCDLHPEKLDYPTPNRAFSYVDKSTSRSISPTSPTSNNNHRYSSTDGLLVHQPHIAEELRSQLPWSYTNLIMDPEVQRKITSHLSQEDDDLPTIPDPDYTLHYPKKDRPQIDVSGGGGCDHNSHH